MCKILLPIKPEYVEKIINGEKLYEFRTKVPTKKINSILIYSTSPVKKIVAEVLIEKIIFGEPNKIWELTKEKSGITKEKYDIYFSERKLAYAYKISKVIKFKIPKELNEFGINNYPQSFVYIY